MKKKLFNKIIPFFQKHPTILILCFKWWAWWSKFYQKIERTFLGTIEIRDIQTFNGSRSPEIAWNTYCTSMGLRHYGMDKWYMLFDVMSLPERFLFRETGDCDEFGFLGYAYFRDHVYTNGDVYHFQGIWSFITEDVGHAVAVWKGTLKEEYFVVSNNEAFFIKTPIFFKDTRFIGKFKYINGYFEFDKMEIISEKEKR